MNNQRDMNKPIDDECYFSKNDASIFEFVNFIVWLNKFQFYNDRMYFYDAEYGIHVLIDHKDEWFQVAKFLNDSVSTKLKPVEVKTLLDKLRLDPRLHRDREFKPHPQFINAENCIVDVITHTKHCHCCKAEFTSSIYAKYDEDVLIDKAPVFKKFCDTSLNGDPSKIKLLLQIIGYICSNYDCAKKAFMLIGKPNSGKSKILEWLCDIIGKENVSNIAFDKLGSRFNIAEFSRSKVNINAELPLEPIKDLSMFKSLIGGDRIQAEEKGKAPFTFKNRCKLLFAGNGLPAVKSQDTTNAFTSRLVILYFPNSINEEDRDLQLSKKLYGEKDIIFSLAVNELQELVKNGFKFEVPNEEEDLLQEYNENSAHIESFIEDMCILLPEYKISTRELYDSYTDYCKDNCFTPYSMQTFSLSIRNIRTLKSTKVLVNGTQRRGLKGIKLKKDIIFNNQDSESEYKK